MIFYFSGTGNSAYVAKRLAQKLGEEAAPLNESIKKAKRVNIPEGRLVFVTPTYAWQIPRVVSEWIREMKFHAGQQVYFVMTCGDAIGNAEKYLKKLCKRKGLTYMGCLQVVMPENYIAMFGVPTEEAAVEIIAKAETCVDAAAEDIIKGKAFASNKGGLINACLSGVVNGLFYPVFVSAKKFYTTEDCVGCGKCAELCPLNNIKIVDGKPLWGRNCTHCMACICRCPKEAIEYGQASVGKRRYVCPGE